MNDGTKKILLGLGIGAAVVLEKIAYRPFIYENHINDFHIADTFPNFGMAVGWSYIMAGIFNLMGEKSNCAGCAALAGTMAAVTNEVLQVKVGGLDRILIAEGRTFDINDIGASLVGGLVAYGLLKWANKSVENNDVSSLEKSAP